MGEANISFFLKNGTLRFNNSFFDEKTTNSLLKKGYKVTSEIEHACGPNGCK